MEGAFVGSTVVPLRTKWLHWFCSFSSSNAPFYSPVKMKVEIIATLKRLCRVSVYFDFLRWFPGSLLEVGWVCDTQNAYWNVKTVLVRKINEQLTKQFNNSERGVILLQRVLKMCTGEIFRGYTDWEAILTLVGLGLGLLNVLQTADPSHITRLLCPKCKQCSLKHFLPSV